MDDNKDLPQNEKKLGRRELLKALAATGGAVTAASILPGKWIKPVIEAGVLPAHAQTSELPTVLTISNLRGEPAVGFSFDYYDPLGQALSDPFFAVALYADVFLFHAIVAIVTFQPTPSSTAYSGTCTYGAIFSYQKPFEFGAQIYQTGDFRTSNIATVLVT